jgi:hypothetical protein
VSTQYILCLSLLPLFYMTKLSYKVCSIIQTRKSLFQWWSQRKRERIIWFGGLSWRRCHLLVWRQFRGPATRRRSFIWQPRKGVRFNILVFVREWLREKSFPRWSYHTKTLLFSYFSSCLSRTLLNETVSVTALNDVKVKNKAVPVLN